MPQETKRDPQNHPHETSGPSGTIDQSDPAAFRRAIELAVDYRGDVTLVDSASGESIECFVFDFKASAGDGPALVRYIAKNSDVRESIPIDRVACVSFTGRDTAAGKSFETWMKKYVQQKLAGQRAGIESESLEDDERLK